jgi:capsular exopolysaccharide synthesis family protein
MNDLARPAKNEDLNVDLPAPPMRNLLEVIWQRKGSVILVLLLAIGLGVAFLRLTEPKYEVSARLVVYKEAFFTEGSRPVTADADFLATQAQILGSPAIVRDALERAPLPSVAEVETDPVPLVLKSLKVEPLRATDVLSVRFRDPDPAEAARFVSAVVNRYQEYTQEETLRLLGKLGDTARVQEKLWEAQVKEKELTQRAGRRHPELLAVQEEVGMWETLLNERRSTDKALAASQAAQRVRTIEGPIASVKPVWPNPKVVLGACVALGLLAGAGLAWVRDQLSPKVRSAADVQTHLGLTTIGGIPRRSTGNALYRARLVRESPESSVAEAFRGLRTRVRVRANSGRGTVIQVVSAREREGKTTVASNLALSFGQLGRKVVIVDADLRRGILHEVFDVPTSKGLTSILRDGMPADEAIQRSPLSEVDVLSRGPDARNPAELLGQPEFEKVLELLRDRYDVVLLDTPPLLPVADATALAPNSDCVLLTVLCGRSALADTVRARDMLDAVGTRLLGVVLNAMPPGARTGFEFRYPYRSSQVRVASRPKAASVG